MQRVSSFFNKVMLLMGVAASLISGGEPALAGSPIVGTLVDSEQLNGVEDIFLSGDLAYLPCREGRRLTVCSIKNLAAPTIVGSFSDPDLDQITGFALEGETAYLASQNSQYLLIVDVSDSAAMKLLGKVRIGQPGSKGPLYKMAYRDGYCYMSHQAEKRLYIVDARDKSRPQVVSHVQVTTADDGAYCVTMHGNYALVGTVFGHPNRLVVVNVENPVKPRIVGEVLAPHLSQVIGVVVGDRMYAACWPWDAMAVINLARLSDTTMPSLEGELVDERLGEPNRCAVVGDRAYLPMVRGDGVAVVDISNPAKPRFLTSFSDPLAKRTYGLAARGDYVYLGARTGDSLVILNRHELEK
ncbi:hypothetical protein M4951_00945 [Blastopirellula sp. J2-11]|uniref:LVIVD repeat-containing protein n=1 Tax=Blastopirellula sp. J2-11 TaxID=2943192 RepID=UPI0021C6C001|nr:hypothetical protein [Blastopirellula sp. J2-11]UUO06895.1 hypothetical protein M4951_00945 [Blastopirellula sp. J2-11]